MLTRQAAKRSTYSRDTIGCFLGSRPEYKKSKRPRKGSKTKSRHANMMDTMMFESYLENLWNKFSEEKKSPYMYLDSLWFKLYMDNAAKPKVLTWITKKQIFLKKYIFVPIVIWEHWSLLILCHFGENQRSKAGKPCMLLLDSLQSIDPRRLEPPIRKFILDIYKSGGRKETEEFISKIPLLIPKVPQQTDGEQCGAFVLYFINLFMQSAPKYFSQDRYPYFLNEDWFDLEDIERFLKEIQSFTKNKGAGRSL